MARWGGSERHLMDITLGLLRRGHEVTVACAPGSLLDGWCRENHLPHVSLEMRHFYEARQTPEFTRAYRAGRYEVVHTHGAFDYFVPAFAARLTRVPAVVMTRHLPHPFRAKWRAYLCSRLLYDKIIAVSQFIATVLTDAGVKEDRIAVVPNGVDPLVPAEGLASLRDELRIPAEAFLVTAAGRLTEVKGFAVLVKAIAQLHQQGVPAYAVIFGHGEEKDPLLQLAQDLGMANFIRFPGYRTDVTSLWLAGDVAVVPSVGPESFSYTVLEAMAAAKPVLASRIGAISELITKECGILVAPGNAAELADSIRTVLTSPERAAMGAAALKRSREFTLDRTISGLEEVYRSILDKTRVNSASAP